jgi:hypothetical protein
MERVNGMEINTKAAGYTIVKKEKENILGPVATATTEVGKKA